MRAPRALWMATAAYVLGWSAHTTFIFYLAPIALRAAGHGDLDAWVFTGTALASIAAALPAGRWADRHPRRRILRAGLVLLGLSYAPLAFGVPSFQGVLLATILTGTGLSLLLVSFNSYVADLLAAQEMSRAYGRTVALGVLAGAVGPFAAAAVFSVAGAGLQALHANAFLFGVASFGGALLTLGLPHVAHVGEKPTPIRLLDVLQAGERTVGPAVLIYLLVGAASGMSMPYFTVHFLDGLGMSEPAWGVWLGLGTAASAAGALLAGWMGRRWAPERVLVAGQAFLALASLPFLGAFPLTILGLAYVGRTFAAFTLSPSVNALMMARVSPGTRARAQAWVNLAWNVGWASGAALGSAALARMGGGTFVAAAFVGLVGVAGGALLLPRR